jgi:hypothetical protein
MTLLPNPDPGKARTLIEQLRSCADQAEATGDLYADAQRRLRRAADALERKVNGA